MEHMKAVQYDLYGGAEVLQQREIPKPKVKGKEVLVKLHAASVNPVDYKLVLGWMKNVPVKPKLPAVPLFDAAGVIEEKGPKCGKRLNVGDRVFLMSRYPQCDCAAEYISIDETYVLPIPDRTAHGLEPLTFSEAAALPLVTVTGMLALEYYARVKPGMLVLVVGASGGTGTVGVQLAKAMGCRVMGVCSGKNAELVRSLGAERVVDYLIEDWAEALKDSKVDVVYDCVGGPEAWTKACKILAPSKGVFVTIAGDSPGPMGLSRMFSMAGSFVSRKTTSWFSTPAYYFYTAFANPPMLEKASKYIAEGLVRPIIAHEYPLSEIREAFNAQEAGRTVGKNVILIQ